MASSSATSPIGDDLFRQELAPIVSRHMMAAKDDAAALAGIFETLAGLLGMAIANGCRGNAVAIDVMLNGAAAHMTETAAAQVQRLRQATAKG